MGIYIDPTETKSVHIKSYVQPSVSREIAKHQIRHKIESFSSAILDLILKGLSAEQEAQSRVLPVNNDTC